MSGIFFLNTELDHTLPPLLGWYTDLYWSALVLYNKYGMGVSRQRTESFEIIHAN